MPLLRYRVELLTDLRRADEALRKADFDEALRLYLGLQEESGSEWLPVRQSARRGDVLYVSVNEHLQQRIGSLPAAGLERYRRRVDAAASDAESRALRSGRLDDLRAAVDRYRHSEVGPKLAELAALRAENAGEFVTAAQLWQLWLELDRTRGQQPPMADPVAASRTATAMVRLALCWQLADRAEAAGRVLSAMRRDAPLAVADLNIAGRRVPAVRFLENRLRGAETGSATVAGEAAHDWPSLTGDAAGSRRMTDAAADISLLPVWRNSSVDLTQSPPNPQLTEREKLRHIWKLELFRESMQRFGFPPEQPFPVVVGDRVLVRFPEAIRAYSLESGKLNWSAAESAVDPAALARAMAEADIEEALLSSPVANGPECGRLGLTVAEGRVFAVEDFPTINLSQVQRARRFGQRFQLRQANRLTARSLETGQLLWAIGRAEPSSDEPRLQSEADKLLGECLFLTAPTEVAGRLYVTAARARDRIERHLFCLSAATGRVIWSAAIGSPQSRDENRDGSPLLMGSPPAVANGVAYVTTNAGLLAAFSAEQGRPLWFYQYARPGERSPNAGREPTEDSDSGEFSGRPPNPILVVGDRVLFLPADAPGLYVLSADSGELIDWRLPSVGEQGVVAMLARAFRAEPRDRRQIAAPQWLLGVVPVTVGGASSSCAVLAGRGGVELVAVHNGRTIRRIPLPETYETLDILGRPALSDQSVYLSVATLGLARVSLSDGVVRYSRLLPDVAWRPVSLGPIVISRGRVISTDGQSVSVYGSFREALARLNAANDDPEAQLRRGHLAMSSGKLDEAEPYFRRAKQLAEQTGSSAAGQKSPHLREANAQLLSVYIRQAGRASSAKRLQLLEQAAAVAELPDESADVRLLQAWAHLEVAKAAASGSAERTEAGTRAARLAQALLEAEPLPVDSTELAQRAERGWVEPDSDTHMQARRVLDRVLSEVGRPAYRFADEGVAAVLRESASMSATDRIAGLERLLAQYPQAAARDVILLQLGGAYAELAEQHAQRTRSATEAGDARRAELRMQQARAHAADALYRLERDYPNSPLLPAARVGWVRLEGDRLGVGRPETPNAIHIGYAAQLTEVIDLLGERARTAGAETLPWPPTADLLAGKPSPEKPSPEKPSPEKPSPEKPSPEKPSTVAETLTALTELRRRVQALIDAERAKSTAAGELPTELTRRHVLGGESVLGNWGGAEVRLLTDTFGRTVSRDGCVFLRTSDGICCVEAATNRLRWRTYADDTNGVTVRNRRNRNNPTMLVGHLFTHSRAQPAPPANSAPPTPADSVTMLAVLEGSVLWLLDAQTGRMLWKVDDLPPLAFVPPAARDGILALVAQPERRNRNGEVHSLVLVDLVGRTVGFTDAGKDAAAQANRNADQPRRDRRPMRPRDNEDREPESLVALPEGHLPTAAVRPALVPGSVAVIDPDDSGISVYSVPEGRLMGRLAQPISPREPFILGSPDGMYFVLTRSGNLVALSATGQERWQYPSTDERRVNIAPRYYDGELTVLSARGPDSGGSGRAVVLSSRTGRVRWETDVKAAGWGGLSEIVSVTRAGDKLILCTSDESTPPLQYPHGRDFCLVATPAATGDRALWKTDLPAIGDADLQKKFYRFFSDGRRIGVMLRFPEGLVDGWLVLDAASGKLLTPKGVIVKAKLSSDWEQRINRRQEAGQVWHADWLRGGLLIREVPEGVEVHASPQP